MSNTVTISGRFIVVQPDGLTDFDGADYFPNGIRLKSVLFVPSSATDELVIRSKSATGPVILKLVSADGGSVTRTFDGPFGRVFPFIKCAGAGGSDQDWSVAANINIAMEFA